MSRKNRKYGNQWLVKKFDLFRWRPYYIVYGWTHKQVGQFPYIRLIVARYIVKTFDSIDEYKAWRRSFMPNIRRNRAFFNKYLKPKPPKKEVQSESRRYLFSNRRNTRS